MGGLPGRIRAEHRCWRCTADERLAGRCAPAGIAGNGSGPPAGSPAPGGRTSPRMIASMARLQSIKSQIIQSARENTN